MYVCCATPESKHWWIEAIDADDPSGLPTGERTVVFPGSDALAVKDPIVEVDAAGAWRAWICCHPLTEPGQEDRMTTAYATSADGLSWDWQGDVLCPTPGAWDQRGARMTTVVSSAPLVVLYDGRASAEDNWFEQTGIARGRGGARRCGPGRSGCEVAALGRRAPLCVRGAAARRAHPVLLRGGRPDGAHDLWTSVSS